jgi:hypothetical protein
MRLAQVFSVLKLRCSGGGKGFRGPDARDSRKAFGVEHLERRDVPAATGLLGQVQLITAPRTVEVHKLEDNSAAKFFSEKKNVVLAASLTVDVSSVGTYSQEAGYKPANILAGTKVNSYYLHADRVGQPAAFLFARGSITFSEPILGVQATQAGLNQSDFLGVTGTRYPKVGREIDGQDSRNRDTFSISSDRRTITFAFQTSNNSDDVRIITATSPLSDANVKSVYLKATGVTTGDRTLAIIAPPTVEPNRLENARYGMLFAEKKGVSLAASLRVDATVPGEYNMKTVMKPATVAAGTKVNSYYLHVDRVASPMAFDVITGSLTFDTPILGVIAAEGNLIRSDFLGDSRTTYPTSRRTLDRNVPRNLDRFWISADMKTLRYEMQTSTACDSLRIITQA